MLEHVRAPEEVVAEVRRVCGPAGTFAGSVPNAFRFQSRLLFLAGLRRKTTRPTFICIAGRARGAPLASPPGALVRRRPLRRLHPRLLARDMVFVARLRA